MGVMKPFNSYVWQQLISPYIIIAEENIKVNRIKEMITC